MKDRYGREINYMRISVTDRCNLRCKYCMPEEGIVSVGHQEILSYDEILQIVKICCKKGIKNIKITGGEPLVRRDLAELINDIKKVEGIEQVTLTTNGVLLGEYLDELVAAGLSGVNISLDTLDPKRYEMLTGVDALDKVLDSINRAANHPALKVKINVVNINELNQDEICSLATLARDKDVDVRFIEMMPIGMGKNFKGYYQDDIMEKLATEFGTLDAVEGKLGNGPATYYKLEGFIGKIGFISSISHKFCGSCNRIRLTADGRLKSCLQYADGVNLKEAIRSNASEAELKELVESAIFLKPKQHEFLLDSVEDGEKNLMNKIGG